MLRGAGMVKLGDLYEAIDDDEAYVQLPAMVAEFVGARSGNIQRIDQSGIISVQNFSYYDGAIIKDYAARFSGDLDIWTQAGLRSGIVNRAVPLEELVSERTFRASPMWNDFFRFHGDDTGHSMGLVHQLDGAIMATSFHRAWSMGGFTQQEAARLDAIANDLHRIFRARNLAQLQAERFARLNDMLDAHQDFIFLVDASTHLIEASSAAMRVLKMQDGVSLSHGHITVNDRTMQAGIDRAVTDTVNRRPVDRATFLAARPSGKAPWRIMVLPAADRRYCSLVLSASERDEERQRRWMRECFSLTKAEVIVAQGILEGKTADEIASHRRSSVATIRTHIRHILEKTATRRITDLVTLLSGLP